MKVNKFACANYINNMFIFYLHMYIVFSKM